MQNGVIYLMKTDITGSEQCISLNILLTFPYQVDSYGHAIEPGLGVYRGIHTNLFLWALKVKRWNWNKNEKLHYKQYMLYVYLNNR